MPLTTTYSRYLRDPTLAGAVTELAACLKLESRLLSVGDSNASAPTAPEKWSRKEILGHLIDSAANNLQRFVRSQIPAHLTDGVLRFPSYAQDEWVRVQRYRERGWSELVVLWSALNQHLLQAMRHVDRTCLEVPCVIGDGAPVTLEALIVDYVGHIRHHMGKVLVG